VTGGSEQVAERKPQLAPLPSGRARRITVHELRVDGGAMLDA